MLCLKSKEVVVLKGKIRAGNSQRRTISSGKRKTGLCRADNQSLLVERHNKKGDNWRGNKLAIQVVARYYNWPLNYVKLSEF